MDSPSLTQFTGLSESFKTQAQVTNIIGVGSLATIWLNAKNKPAGVNTPQTVKKLWELVMDGVYVNVCMYDVIKETGYLREVFTMLVTAYPPDLAKDEVPLLRAMLFMLGAIGAGTGLHLDWKNAINLAILIGPCANFLPVALWLFIRPTAEAVAAVHEYLKQKLSAKHPHGLEMWRAAAELPDDE